MAHLGRAVGHRPAPARRVEVLAINSISRNCLSLRSILGHTNWIVDWASDFREAMNFLESRPVAVVVCPAEMSGASWKDILAAVVDLPNPPKVLIYAEHAANDLWIDILNLGGYDFLPLPFVQELVLRTISLASRQWNDDARRKQQLTAANVA